MGAWCAKLHGLRKFNEAELWGHCFLCEVMGKCVFSLFTRSAWEQIKVTYEVSGTCTPLQLLKISGKIEVMGQIEIKQTFCGHLWSGFSTKSTIFWRGLANSFTTPWLHVLTAISAVASTAIFPSCFSLKGSIACHVLASHGFMDAKAMSTRGITQRYHALANRAFFSSSTCESGGFSPSIVPWLKVS